MRNATDIPFSSQKSYKEEDNEDDGINKPFHNYAAFLSCTLFSLYALMVFMCLLTKATILS